MVMVSGLRAAAPESSSRHPPAAGKILDPRPPDDDALGLQQGALEAGLAAIAAELPCRGDDAVAGHVARLAIPHDVADGPGGPRPAGELGDVPVSGDPPGRDPPDGGQHSRREVGHKIGRRTSRAPSKAQLPTLPVGAWELDVDLSAA